MSWELGLLDEGITLAAGVDEVGRGAIAGPVAAAVLILPLQDGMQSRLVGVDDSKKLSPLQRETWAHILQDIALDHAVGFSSSVEIDTLGIIPATRLAAGRALSILNITPQHMLVDYIKLDGCPIPQTSLVKGDARCLSIAGASILAKTARDLIMQQFSDMYPGYGFQSNMGYATTAHRKALAEMGPCAIHRRSFKVKP